MVEFTYTLFIHIPYLVFVDVALVFFINTVMLSGEKIKTLQTTDFFVVKITLFSERYNEQRYHFDKQDE